MKLISSAAALLCAALLGPAVAPAAPVTDALQRPALAVKQPQRSVLLAAARAGERLVAVGERGIVVVSDDHGASWRQVPCPVSVTLTAVRFADARHGVIVGHGGTALTTSDGGASWAVRLDGRRLAQRVLETARVDGDAVRLKDAERLVADGPDKPLLDVLMFDTRRILAVGAYGIALYSDDGGERWSSWSARLENPKALHLYAVRRAGDSLLVAGEQGLLLRSDDNGASFRRLSAPYKGSFFTGEMLSPSELLVAGLRGNVWRSSDAGASWSQVSVPMPASVTATAVGADGAVLLANQAGVVLRLQGATPVPLNTTPLPMPGGLLVAADGRVLTLGVGGVVPVQGAAK
jgi:photosystem II stability/assembly factor-like uncharacterized protein